MRAGAWRMLVALLVGFGLLILGLTVVLTRLDTHDLSQAICQPGDLGARYHPSSKPPAITNPYLGETVVASKTIQLIDLQLTYTMLDCILVQYADEAAAHRAFARVCQRGSERALPMVGDEACSFTDLAPRNLAFRRNIYLVVMKGDITDFPDTDVDRRLQ